VNFVLCVRYANKWRSFQGSAKSYWRRINSIGRLLQTCVLAVNGLQHQISLQRGSLFGMTLIHNRAAPLLNTSEKERR
jgi:hypothetical protein